MEIRLNFFGGSPGFFRGGVFISSGGSLIFANRVDLTLPPPCTAMTPIHLKLNVAKTTAKFKCHPLVGNEAGQGDVQDLGGAGVRGVRLIH